jgi:hypothetical protein
MVADMVDDVVVDMASANDLHYYREGHLQQFKIAISCDFWTAADVPLLR